MVFELELPVATTETTIVKKAIVKSEARTQLTAAKKKKVPSSLFQVAVHGDNSPRYPSFDTCV
jgi:hypothetical protein